MNSSVRNILAIIIGVLVGIAVKTGLGMISGDIISPPEGADVSTIEGLKASLHLYQPKHFIMPFLSHALGAFIGALVASLIAIDNKMRLALSIGLFFLVGGVFNIFILPSPTWFTVLDIVAAYIPMSYLAGKLALFQAKL